jgi:hypothetical protein
VKIESARALLDELLDSLASAVELLARALAALATFVLWHLVLRKQLCKALHCAPWAAARREHLWIKGGPRRIRRVCGLEEDYTLRTVFGTQSAEGAACALRHRGEAQRVSVARRGRGGYVDLSSSETRTRMRIMRVLFARDMRAVGMSCESHGAHAPMSNDTQLYNPSF